MPDRNVRSSLRRSRSPAGILLLLYLLLAPAAWGQAPSPDPPPSGLAPDPPPDAVAPPPPPAVRAEPPVVAPPAPAPARAATERAQRPAAPAKKPQPEPKPQPQPQGKAALEQAAAVDSEPRDSLMPRVELGPPAKVVERSRLVLAGLALVIVALGGAVVLGAGRRALVEAGA